MAIPFSEWKELGGFYSCLQSMKILYDENGMPEKGRVAYFPRQLLELLFDIENYTVGNLYGFRIEPLD
jgi:hypothetical protein